MATIRINNDDKRKLDKICHRAKLSQAEVFHLAIVALQKRHLSKRLKLDFEALEFDSAVLAAYKTESEKFDRVSSDGLIDLRDEYRTI